MSVPSLLVVTLTLGLCGCASPERIGDDHPVELRQIVKAYETCVAGALADQKTTWVHGWDGNDRIAAGEESGLKGLCYEWQELVYSAVQPVAHRQGWQASLLTINEDWFSEHHAVLVHAQGVGSAESVLERRLDAAWVLDPWLEGRAEVFRLDDWLGIPWIVFNRASIETVPSRKP